MIAPRGGPDTIEFAPSSEDPFTNDLEGRMCTIPGVLGVVISNDRRVCLIRDGSLDEVWKNAYRMYLTGYGLYVMEESAYLAELDKKASQDE